MPRPPGKFRFQGVRLLLTYSQSGPLNKPELHAFLAKKCKQEVSIKICHEHHEDGNIHTHVVMLLQRSIDVQSERFFDYMGHHPNVKPPSNNDHWRNQIAYVDKEDPEVYCFGEIPIEKTKDELFADACEYVKNCKSLKQMYAMSPHLKIISSKVSFFENFWKTQHTKMSVKARFQITSFRLNPITDWSTSWLIWGKARSGKTQFALAHFQNPLLIRHLDKLLEFDEDEHDGIVFDELSFTHWTGDHIIGLIDVDEPQQVNVRYKVADLPAKVKKIFCHNNANIFIPDKETSDDQMEGISRRYQSIHVDAPLY